MWKIKSTDRPTSDMTELSEKVSRLVAENNRLAEEFTGMQQHFRSLARSVWRVQEDERKKLARELHDGVGQNLTALRYMLEKLPEFDDRNSAVTLVGAILEDVREMSRLLRPPVLDDLGLAPALQWLGRRVRDSSALEVVIEVDALEDLELDDDAETLLFRVVQEALHNAVRHSQADVARVSAARAGNRLEIRISDDGDGFDPAALQNNPERAGTGLAGMNDRVGIFGGDLALRSQPGKGTTIIAGLPLDSAIHTNGASG